MKKLKYNLEMLFNDVWNDGATYHFDDVGIYKNPTYGYVVGMNNFVGKFDLSKSGKDLMGELLKAVKHCNNIIDTIEPDECLGLWVDIETNILYIEKTALIQDKVEALDIADGYGEIAIWDCKNSCEIRLKK